MWLHFRIMRISFILQRYINERFFHQPQILVNVAQLSSFFLCVRREEVHLLEYVEKRVRHEKNRCRVQQIIQLLPALGGGVASRYKRCTLIAILRPSTVSQYIAFPSKLVHGHNQRTLRTSTYTGSGRSVQVDELAVWPMATSDLGANHLHFIHACVPVIDCQLFLRQRVYNSVSVVSSSSIGVQVWPCLLRWPIFF